MQQLLMAGCRPPGISNRGNEGYGVFVNRSMMGSPSIRKVSNSGLEIVNYRSSGHRASDYERASKRSIGILLDLKGDTRRCSSHLIYRFFLIDIKNPIKNKEQDGHGILSRYFDRIKMKRDGNLILNGIVITGVEAGSGRK